MRAQIEERLARLDAAGGLAPLRTGITVGLERECLRVAPDGVIAFTPHPRTLGSSLTHPWITTDYSEALLELVTPPFGSPPEVLDFLRDLHLFVYRRIHPELLWAGSMPCILAGEQNIPIAEYGTSNRGRMKHVYRVGLGHRYGRVMQVIAGVHFNCSFADGFWEAWQAALGQGGRLRSFRDDGYMGLIRNLQRFGWLVPYLFGSSPAVCRTFLDGRPTRMAEFDESTDDEPTPPRCAWATSATRTGARKASASRRATTASVRISKASSTRSRPPACCGRILALWSTASTGSSMPTPADRERVLQHGAPQADPRGPGKAHLALKRRGIRYIELRSPDVNVFEPLGVDEDQLRFLEAFVLLCLLVDSPVIRLQERCEIDRNLEKVAHRGRDPELRLLRNGLGLPLQAWASELLEAMDPLCTVLEQARGGAYRQVLAAQRAKVADPELTPSARVLAEMLAHGESFHGFARRQAEGHRRHLGKLALTPGREAQLEQEAAASLVRQAAIEAADDVDFGAFLDRYFSQA